MRNGTEIGTSLINLAYWQNAFAPNDTSDDVVVCSTAPPLTLTRDKNPSKFTNVTKDLTTLTFTVNGVTTQVNIFDNALNGYFWNYDNHGLRLAQVRFYPTTPCP